MKKKFSKILGVGLTLALLTSLLLTAAPVSALSQPTVTFTPTTDSVISETNAGYVITFQLVDELVPTDKIVVTFPEGTIVDAVPTVTIFGWTTPTLAYQAVGTPAAARVGTTLEVELTWATRNITSLGTVKITFVTGIDNPADPGDDYTLTVGTRDTGDTVIEAAVTSAEYEITPPEPTTPAGVVQLWNPSDILMENYTGPSAIDDAYFDAGDDYVVKVGAGRYVSDISVDTDVLNVTIESATGAADTIIVGDVTIADDGVTLDGFTIHGVTTAGVIIDTGGDNVTVQNCVFLEEGEAQTMDHMEINWAADGVLIQDNTFTVEDGFLGIYTWAGAVEITNNDFILEAGTLGLYIDDTDTEATGNTFTGSSGQGILVYEGIIKDNIFDGLETGVEVDGETVTIEGNTFQNGADGAAILVTYIGVKAVIANNTFTANADYVLSVINTANADLVYMNFNSIEADNEGDADGYVLSNADGVLVVNAQANWWDDAAGPDTAIFNDAALFNYEPFLVAATAGDGAADADTNDFDAEVDNGVTVTVTAGNATDDDADGIIDDMNIVGSATYAANPAGAAPTGAVGYWDIFVGSTEDDVTELTIRIYTDVTEDTEVHVWAVGKGEWLPADATPNLFGGFMSIVVDANSTPTIEDLAGLPFVVVDPGAAALDTPVLTAPTSGADDVSLKPTLVWGTVPGAIGYDFELAGNPLFVLPIVSLTGDVSRLIVPFYQQVTPLEYSTYYYWRVKAASADAESAWSSGVFYTVAEVIPEEPEAEVWMCSEGLTFATREALEAHLATAEAHQPVEPPEIIVESPDVIVPLPAETPITPAWIYVIIGVGAVLVIGLIVLIVRTRRVA